MEPNPYQPSDLAPPVVRGKRRRIAGYVGFVLGLVLWIRVSWIATTWQDLREKEVYRIVVLFCMSGAMIAAGLGLLYWARNVARRKS